MISVWKYSSYSDIANSPFNISILSREAHSIERGMVDNILSYDFSYHLYSLLQTLTILSLHTNQIGDQGAQALSDALKTNKVCCFSTSFS